MELFAVEIDTLTIIGFIIILAYLDGKAVQRVGIPQVVGFILVGVLLGSSFLKIVPLSLARELGFISWHEQRWRQARRRRSSVSFRSTDKDGREE